MKKPTNAIELFWMLERSNCKKCGEKTCLAFANAVFAGTRKLHECPRLSPELMALCEEQAGAPRSRERSQDDHLKTLKAAVPRLDLSARAARLGGELEDGKLTLKMLGKDVSVNEQGDLFTELHINHWMAVPFLTYVVYGQGLPVSGKWVAYRDLRDGRARYPLFQKRCEEVMKRVADDHTELFDAAVHLFSGEHVAKSSQGDISVVLYPLPKVPIMISYWSPDEELESSLHVFFDETADRNLDAYSVFNLGTGIAHMLEKIAQTHGFTATRR